MFLFYNLTKFIKVFKRSLSLRLEFIKTKSINKIYIIINIYRKKIIY